MSLLNFNLAGFQESRENKKIIEQTQKKRDQLLKSYDQQIEAKRNEIEIAYTKIGNVVYEKYTEFGNSIIDTQYFVNYIEEINQIQDDIIKLEQKRQDIEKRYTEEMDMLTSLNMKSNDLQNMAASSKDNSTSASVSPSFCTNCGSRIEGNATFCTNCGTKI